MDFRRLAQLGKKGCYTGSSFVSSSGLVSQFQPKSQVEILDNSGKIASLNGAIGRKVNTINDLGLKAKNKYQEYLETHIDVCEPPSVSGAVVGSITSAIGIEQETFGATAFKKCLDEQNKKRAPLDEAQKAFTKMQNTRSELYADFSELLQFAPNANAWRTLCEKKIGVDEQFTRLGSSVSDLASKALKKLKGELANQAQAEESFNRMLNFLEAFLNALKQLLAALAEIFGQFIKGFGKLAEFAARHPVVLWGGVGVISLAVLAAVFRPYISILSAVTRKK